MPDIADHALRAVEIEFPEARLLAECDGGRHAAGCGAVELAQILVSAPPDVPARERIAKRRAVDGAHIRINEARAFEFTQYGHDAAGAMHVLEVNIGNRGRNFAEHRHAP